MGCYQGDQPFRIRPRSSSAASSINSLRPFAIRLDDNSDKKGSNFTKEVSPFSISAVFSGKVDISMWYFRLK